jgi:hypothetical protein
MTNGHGQSVDKNIIKYDDPLTLSIEAIATELSKTLMRSGQRGGNYKIKQRLARRSNIKHNTKTKKRIQNKYRR